MATVAALTELIAPEAQALGFDLVRVKMFGGDDPTLQVMAERPDTRQLTLEDCMALSRRISERLDALEAAGRDPIDHAYRLEVSSPGIDRPLTRLHDFADWAGHEARLSVVEPIDGRKQFNGDVIGVDGDRVGIVTKTGDVWIDFTAIKSAKLAMTDRLIAATAPISAEGADDVLTEDLKD